MTIEIKHITIDGKRMVYTSMTEFLVQVGKNRSAYRTRYRFVGNIHQAAMYYRAINVGLGYKKRLYAPSMKVPTIAKMVT
jgi:hypothetical protein